MKRNIIEKNIEVRCGLCRESVMVDKYGAGRCRHCGWIQVDVDEPDRVLYPNLVSFNKAKELYSQGKLLTPNFEEFVEGLKNYRHMEFYHNNKKYGVTWEYDVALYQWDIIESTKTYRTPKEFLLNAKLNGVLLKAIWDEVEKANYMQ